MKIVRTKFASIRIRLTLWYVLLLAFILAGFSVLVYLFLDERLDQQVDDQLKSVAQQTVKAALQSENGRIALGRVEGGESEINTLAEQGFLIRIVSPDSTVLISLGPYNKLAI